MPRIYSIQKKRHALYLIEQSCGDVKAVSRELHIPVRTLRDWQDSRRAGILSPKKDPAAAYTGSPNAEIDPIELRDRLLLQIDLLSRQRSADPRHAYFTALAVERHLEQVRRLNEVIDPIKPPPRRARRKAATP
jgi:transposase-like protein